MVALESHPRPQGKCNVAGNADSSFLRGTPSPLTLLPRCAGKGGIPAVTSLLQGLTSPSLPSGNTVHLGCVGAPEVLVRFETGDCRPPQGHGNSRVPEERACPEPVEGQGERLDGRGSRIAIWSKVNCIGANWLPVTPPAAAASGGGLRPSPYRRPAPQCPGGTAAPSEDRQYRRRPRSSAIR